MVGERGKQSGESTVPEVKQRTDRNDRQIYGWSDTDNADAEDCRDVKCVKGA